MEQAHPKAQKVQGMETEGEREEHQVREQVQRREERKGSAREVLEEKMK